MFNFIKVKVLILSILGIFLWSGCSATTTKHILVSSNSTQTNSSINSYLESIKESKPKLIVFLNSFPKGADLHNHASGAAYIEFGLEYAVKNGYYYDINKLKIIASSDDIKHSNIEGCDASSANNICLIKVSKLISNPKMLAKFLDIASMRGWHQNTANGQDHFFTTFEYASIPKRDKSEYLALIAARNYSQGVRYIELMTSSVPWRLFKHAKTLIDKDSFTINDIAKSYAKLSDFLESKEFKQSVMQHMDKRENRVNQILLNKQNITIKGNTPDIVIRYIPQLYRLKSNFDVFVEAAVNMKASSIDNRIVATNMVQNESALNSRINFDAQMKILNYLWKQLKQPNIALHAGELVLRESPLEPMRDRISKSISLGHASRIGHGVSIPWETNPTKTMALMKNLNIAIEICLSSNDIILGIKGKDHPFPLYKDAGVPITIATDDEGISRSNLTMEYIKAIQNFNLNYEDIKYIAQNGLIYSFLSGDGIYKADRTIKRQFKKYLSDNKPTVKQIGLKQYLQIMLERDFIKHSKLFSKL